MGSHLNRANVSSVRHQKRVHFHISFAKSLTHKSNTPNVYLCCFVWKQFFTLFYFIHFLVQSFQTLKLGGIPASIQSSVDGNSNDLLFAFLLYFTGALKPALWSSHPLTGNRLTTSPGFTFFSY